jgi:hypothetical protein
MTHVLAVPDTFEMGRPHRPPLMRGHQRHVIGVICTQMLSISQSAEAWFRVVITRHQERGWNAFPRFTSLPRLFLILSRLARNPLVRPEWLRCLMQPRKSNILVGETLTSGVGFRFENGVSRICE